MQSPGEQLLIQAVYGGRGSGRGSGENLPRDRQTTLLCESGSGHVLHSHYRLGTIA